MPRRTIVFLTVHLLGGLLLSNTPVFAQTAPADTVRLDLEAAIVRSLEVSPEVGQVATQHDYAEARWQLARSSRFLTQFQATSAHAAAPGLKDTGDTPNDALYLNPDVRNDWDDLRPFNRLEVELTQPIYTWGELGGNIRAAEHGVAVEAAAVRGKEEEIALRTGELYYGLLLTEALTRLTTEAGDIVNQAKREIRRLLDEGASDVDDADEYQVLITEQEFLRRVTEVEQRRTTARVALSRQLFLPEGTTVHAADNLLEPLVFTLDPLETYFDRALTHRAELAQAEAGLAAREALIEVARSDYYPKFFAAATATYAYAEGRYRQRNPYVGDAFLSRSIKVGVGMRQKLNFAQTHARVEQSKAEYNEVRFQQQAATQLILFQVEEAYRALITAQAALDAEKEKLRLSKEWLLTEQVNFDLELGDTENLVRAVQANLELQASELEAIHAYNRAVLRLLHATGELTAFAQSGTLVD